MTKHEKIYDLIDKNARTLVGTLLKRVDILSTDNKLNPELYKTLTREIIYENSRGLKNLINVFLNFDSVNYQSKGR